jgi:hypothetical protein
MSKDDGLSPTPMVNNARELAENREDITRAKEQPTGLNRGKPPRIARPELRPGGRLEQDVHVQVARESATAQKAAGDRDPAEKVPSPEEQRAARIAEFREQMKVREVFNRVRNNDKDRGR